MDVMSNTRVPPAIPGAVVRVARTPAAPHARPAAPARPAATPGWVRTMRGPAHGPVPSLTAGGGYLLVIGAEVVVLEADGVAAGRLPERVVRDLLVGGRGRVDGGPRILGRLHPDAAVPEHSGAGRDQLADDDVLLQAQQRVRLGVDGGVGEHPGRLLERGRR